MKQLRIFSYALAFVLLQLGVFFESTIVKLMSLVAFGAVILYNITSSKSGTVRFRIPVTVGILLIIVALGAIRNNDPNSKLTYHLFVAATFIMAVFAFATTINRVRFHGEDDLAEIFYRTVYFPFFVLILANLVAYIVFGQARGSNTGIGEAVVLSGLGVHVSRVNFPISPGYNSYGTILGAFVLLSLIGIWFFKKRKKFIAYTGLFASVISLLLVDTRSAMLYALLIFFAIIFFFWRSQSLRFIWLLPIITIFGSTILLVLLGYVSHIDGFGFLARSDGDLETGNSRNLIWAASAKEFMEFKPIHIVGYGEFGHYESGASQQWALLFGGDLEDRAEYTTPHSVFYSVLFDYGYIGIFIVIMVQIAVLKMLKKYWSRYKKAAVFYFAVLVYWTLVGVTETFFGSYNINVMYLMILVVLNTYLIRYYDQQVKEAEE